MAKKNKRTVRTASTVSVASTASTSTANRAPEFNPDYTYIKRDLNRIGVLAGSFFALLIALSFFIK